MRSDDEIATVMELIAAGLTDSEIARRTAIPRRTVADWRRSQPRRSATPCCGINRTPLPARQYAYLLGLYLGDGCLSKTHRPGVLRLRIIADAKYPCIIDECAAAMEAIFPSQRAHRYRRLASRCVEISMYSKHWACLFPQHGSGRKHHRKIELASWQLRIVEQAHESFLRGLIHSDGCRIIARERQANRIREAPRYVFSNRSEDIKDLFCQSCDALGIRWTRPNSKDIAIYRLQSVARMDEFIGHKA